MQSLSKKDENTILSTVKRATALVDDERLTPNSAIVKAASENKLRANFVPLVVHAYNTGRTTFQRETSDNILDKMASFEMADTDAVLGELYPSEVKTAFDTSMDFGVSDAYSKAPKPLLKNKLADNQRLKVALHLEKTAAAPVQSGADQVRKAYNKILEEKRATDRCRLKLSQVKDQFAATVSELGDYFKLAYSNVSFAEFEHNALLIHGEHGQKVADYVWKQLGRRREKRASAVPFQMRPIERAHAPYSLLDKAIKLSKEASAAQANYEARAKASVKIANEAMAPFDHSVQPRKVNVLCNQPAQEKSANFFAGMVASGLGSALSTASRGSQFAKPTDQLVEGVQNQLSDPAHEDELRAIRTRAMVAHLLSNDEVISGYQPEEVMQAYNEIASISPRASNQMAIVQPLLRKRLTMGAIEPFEAAEMANIENVMRKNTDPLPARQMI